MTDHAGLFFLIQLRLFILRVTKTKRAIGQYGRRLFFVFKPLTNILALFAEAMRGEQSGQNYYI